MQMTLKDELFVDGIFQAIYEAFNSRPNYA